MAASIDIVWKTKGFDTFLKQVQSAEAAVKSVPSSVAVQFKTTGAGPRGRSGPSYVGGPFQRQQQLNQQLAQALKLGHTAAGKDVHLALARNARQMQAMTPKSFGGRALDVLKTTRFNAGAASPLIGRTLAALGPEVEALAGPIGLVVGALTVAATGLYKLAETSAALGNQFAQLKIATGGTTGESARLSVLGSAGGLSSGAIATISQSIQSAITSSPLGMAAGAQLGVQNMPGYLGHQDYARDTLTVADRLRAIHSQEERLRLARAVGAEGLLPLANLPDKQYAMTKTDARLKSAVMTPQFVQQSEAFQAAMGRVSDSFENLEAALGPVVLQQITDFLNGIANAINSFASFALKNQATIASIFAKYVDYEMALLDASHGDFKGAGEHLLSGVNGKDDRLVKSLDDNTRATSGNTGALLKPGAYGNITRPGSMPPGILDTYHAGYHINRQLAAGGFLLSSF